MTRLISNKRTKARELSKIGKMAGKDFSIASLYAHGQYYECGLLKLKFGLRARMASMKRSMPHGIISRPTIPRRRKRAPGKDLTETLPDADEYWLETVPFVTECWYLQTMLCDVS